MEYLADGGLLTKSQVLSEILFSVICDREAYGFVTSCGVFAEMHRRFGVTSFERSVNFNRSTRHHIQEKNNFIFGKVSVSFYCPHLTSEIFFILLHKHLSTASHVFVLMINCARIRRAKGRLRFVITSQAWIQTQLCFLKMPIVLRKWFNILYYNLIWNRTCTESKTSVHVDYKVRN